MSNALNILIDELLSCEEVIEFKKLEENIAIEMFLKSKVYSLLENEKTKIWQYSPLTIAMLYIDESMNKLNLSEV